MKTITITEFQENFDSIIKSVEEGHQFLIQSGNGNVLMMPYKIYEGGSDDLIRIHTDHEEGS